MVSVLRFSVLALLCSTAGAQILAPANGGTGQDSTAWTGCVSVTAGVWSYAACPVVPSLPLSPTNGGTGQDSSGWTGCPSVLSGVWSSVACPATLAAVAHNFLTSYTSTTGLFTQAQPAFTDISGNLGTSQGPSGLTGVLYDTTGALTAQSYSTLLTNMGLQPYGTLTTSDFCTYVSGTGIVCNSTVPTVNTAARYDVPYYSAAGTTNTLSGAAISGFQIDSTSAPPAAATANQLGALINIHANYVPVSAGTSLALTGTIDFAEYEITGVYNHSELLLGGSLGPGYFQTASDNAGNGTWWGSAATGGTPDAMLGPATTPADQDMLYCALVNLPPLGTGVTGCKQVDTGYHYNAIPNAYVTAVPLPTPGTSITLSAPRGIAVCTGACTVTLPVPAAGDDFLIRNDTGINSIITLGANTGVYYENTNWQTYTASGAQFASAGAYGDRIEVCGRDSTHYILCNPATGTWAAVIPISWTYINEFNDLSSGCFFSTATSTVSCAVTVSGVTAGDTLLGLCAVQMSALVSTITLTTCTATSAGDSWTHMPAQLANVLIPSYGSNFSVGSDGSYLLSAAGGETSVTMTATTSGNVNSSGSSFAGFVIVDLQRSGSGSPAWDSPTSGSTSFKTCSATGSSCANTAVPTFSLTGTKDACIQWAFWSEYNIAGPSSGTYIHPNLTDNVTTGSGYYGIQNVTSMASQTYAFSGGVTGDAAVLSAACVK